jgi:hypothetical protein
MIGEVPAAMPKMASTVGDAFMMRALGERRVQSNIGVGSSIALPGKLSNIGAVITSPPYCTRLDYAIATAPELAVLGMPASGFRSLREDLIGSPVVGAAIPARDQSWGKECNAFLRKVEKHTSKASRTYYLRTHLRYFDLMYRSLGELRRVSAPGAPCFIVAQDSYYKDVHNDLPLVIAQMAGALGFTLKQQYDFPSSRHMGRVNRSASLWRSSGKAVESVLWLTA